MATEQDAAAYITSTTNLANDLWQMATVAENQGFQEIADALNVVASIVTHVVAQGIYSGISGGKGISISPSLAALVKGLRKTANLKLKDPMPKDLFGDLDKLLAMRKKQ